VLTAKIHSLKRIIHICSKHHKIIETITNDILQVEKNYVRMKIILRNIFLSKSQTLYANRN